MTSSIYVLASIIFAAFGSGEIQPWNDELPEGMSIDPIGVPQGYHVGP